MKVGETYRNKINKYISQIVEITPTHIILRNKQGVIDKVKSEHFYLNWIIHDSVRSYKSFISKSFPGWVLLINDDFITVADGDTWIKFSINNNSFCVEACDLVSNLLNLETNHEFKIERAEVIINMIASLFTD